MVAQVDRAQCGQKRALQCRSDCTGELKRNEDGSIDGEGACPVEMLLETKAVIEKNLKLVPPMQIEEAVFADYALWAEVDRGWTVVALDEVSPLMTTAWKGKSDAFMIVTKAEENQDLRYRRGMVLHELAADGVTLLEVTPNSKGLWFEVPGKPYLVRPWTGAKEISSRRCGCSPSLPTSRRARRAASCRLATRSRYRT